MLNRLCWAIGSISGAMQESEEILHLIHLNSMACYLLQPFVQFELGCSRLCVSPLDRASSHL